MAGQSPRNGQNDYEEVIRSFIGSRLRSKGIYITGYESETRDDPIATIGETLRRVGDELENSNAEFFGNMCRQLSITPNNAHPTFTGIADEIFVSGKNWGRIVAFLTFGSTFAIHCASRHDLGHDYVDRIVSWISIYMEINLDSWMKQHGSWKGFIDFFDKSDDGLDGASGQNGFLVSALAGLGVGALLMMSLK